MNSERVSNNIREIDRTTKEMSTGLFDVSKNIHLINEGTDAVMQNADSIKALSEDLLKISNVLDESVSVYKTSQK